MNDATIVRDAGPPGPPPLARFLASLTGRRVALSLAVAFVVAAVLNPIFITPFFALLGRALFIAIVLVLAFTAAGHWPARLPRWVSRWAFQVTAVALAVPLATSVVYLLSVGGNVAALRAEERVQGFLWTAGAGLFTGLLLALGALYRERDAEARSRELAFALERSTLEKQALDARLALLHSQIEPHFLFNTLANVQALVEAGSPRAAPVLASLIEYLRAAVPRLGGAISTLGDELSLVRAYLELMRMRMPDRLSLAYDLDASLDALPFPSMALLTLVENAVRHGIDPSEEGGRIVVRTRRDGDRVRVTVEDSGVGMSPTARPGTGVVNLRERLAAYFGADARLELREASPHGVVAELGFAPRGDVPPATVAKENAA